MYLENIVVDAADPQRLGGFWEAVVGGTRLTDEPDLVETRVTVEGGPELDLCFPRVLDAATEAPRLHVDLSGRGRQVEEVDRLLGLGARPLDLGQGEVPWVVLADPEGNPFCVLEDRAAYDGSGPIAALALYSADPDRDAAFWSWLTGWVDVAGSEPRALRHRSGRGPLIELLHEPRPAGAVKNRLHLDVRLEGHDDPDAVGAGIAGRGGAELEVDWGELPWRCYADPSGNEFCVLPARR